VAGAFHINRISPYLTRLPPSVRFLVSVQTYIMLSRTVISLVRKNSAASNRLASSKVFPSAAAAVEDIKSGSTLLVGGFGLCGIPEFLISAVKAAGPT
jgi:hypothetical protein